MYTILAIDEPMEENMKAVNVNKAGKIYIRSCNVLKRETL